MQTSISIDTERLVGLGLLNHWQWCKPLTSDVILTKYHLWYTWESILSQDWRRAKEYKRLNSFPKAARAFGSSKKAYWYEQFFNDSD
jgi:hypothetical protein